MHRPLAVSVAQAAQLSGLSRSFLYLLIREGSLPSIKVGHRRLIRVAELEAWLQAPEHARGGPDAR